MNFDTLIVIGIVAAAIGYIVYRYTFKKKGGCGCGCSGCDAQPGKHTKCQ